MTENGTIEFEEFLSLLLVQMEKKPDQEIREAFELFDKDGDGRISIEEMKHILKNLGKDSFTDAEVEEVIRAGDLNGDGLLDYEGNTGAHTLRHL